MARFKTAWGIILLGMISAANGEAPASAPGNMAQTPGSSFAQETRPSPSAKKFHRSRGMGRDRIERYRQDRAWLGVQLAPVPATLAAHLPLRSRGVMVRNVFNDSPAHKAGLDRYDVIVAVDGKDLARGSSAFAKLITSRKPGDKVKLSFYQHGQLVEKEIALDETKHRDEMSLKYTEDAATGYGPIYGMYGRDSRPYLSPWHDDRSRAYPEDLPPPSPLPFRRYEPGERFPEPPGQPRYEQSPSSRPYEQMMPEAEFDVRADGSITAHVEDGPTELNMTFPSEEAFKKQAPKLYEQYRATVEKLK